MSDTPLSSAAPASSPSAGTTFVSIASPEIETKRRNLYLLNALINFIWIFFHFTVIYFFTLKLGSIGLVGIFLGLGNLVSLLADSPIGVLQKYIPARRLFLASGAMIFVATLIFLKFIFDASEIDMSEIQVSSDALMSFFRNDLANISFVILAAILYGLIKEVNEVTITSYILNNADPSEYATIIGRNNIYGGVGAFVGLLASFVIVFNTFMALFILLGSIACLMVYLAKFFDSGTDTLTFDKIQNLKCIVERISVEQVREYVITQVRKTDFRAIAHGARYIFLRPMALRTFDWAELKQTAHTEIISTIRTVREHPRNASLLWVIAVVGAFAFWDSFIAAFLIPFLDGIIRENASNGLIRTGLVTPYVLLGIIILPVFLFQNLFISLAKVIGNLPVIMGGLLVCAVSIAILTFFHGFGAILLLGALNSIGYAASMPLAMAAFLDIYNSAYAEKLRLGEIDSNASAAPMKILINT